MAMVIRWFIGAVMSAMAAVIAMAAVTGIASVAMSIMPMLAMNDRRLVRTVTVICVSHCFMILLAALRWHQLRTRPKREAGLVGCTICVAVWLVPLRHASSSHLAEHHKEAEGAACDGGRNGEGAHGSQSLCCIRKHVHQGSSQEDARGHRVAKHQQPVAP